MSEEIKSEEIKDQRNKKKKKDSIGGKKVSTHRVDQDFQAREVSECLTVSVSTQ